MEGYCAGCGYRTPQEGQCDWGEGLGEAPHAEVCRVCFTDHDGFPRSSMGGMLNCMQSHANLLAVMGVPGAAEFADRASLAREWINAATANALGLPFEDEVSS